MPAARLSHRAKYIPLGLILLCVVVLAVRTYGATGEERSVRDKRFLPCPEKPNCVSTLDETEGHAIAPYRYQLPLKEAKAVVKQIVSGIPRTTLVGEEEDYLHYTVRSALFGFVDDVEFVFDDVSKILHFRSASRSGYYDFGVNRRRMEHIRQRLDGRL